MADERLIHPAAVRSRSWRGVSLAAFAVAAALFMCSVAARAQISPGPLSKAHGSISGPTQCTACHRVGGGSRDFRCLDCHKDLAARISAGRGLHASYVGRSAPATECAKCHSEHNGENFNLVRWDPTPGKFDHSKTGFALEGKHAALPCARCHNAALIVPAERERLTARDMNRTFLGLANTCVSCHEDKHRGQLGRDCQRCHNAVDWKLSRQFDHSKTRYPLTGAHATVTCQKCHTPIGGSPTNLNYVGLTFDKCTGCHTDPHKGAFQQACQSCHNTASWKRVSVAGKFDHTTTKYPLLGKHASVECTKCHAGGDFKRPVAFAQCNDCHKPDPHGGQFAKRADGGKCESCHTVEGFKPARFGVEEHKATGYPLEGKHADVQCARCHVPAGRATVYKLKFARCTDCHRDYHLGQFSASMRGAECAQCHTVRGFKPSTYTLARHKESRFPLTAGHVAVPCGDCHRTDFGEGATKIARFQFADLQCTQCHSDPHKGQFRERMARTVAGGATAGCTACHSMKSWKDLSRFDHGTTEFQLSGSHRAVTCSGCHKPPNLELNLRNVDFKKTPRQCENCHADVHGSQFAQDGVTRCVECHNSMKWRPSTFDHETRTSFPLKGAHQNVACKLCHTAARNVADKQVVFYKPTPKRCAECHGATVPAATR